MTTVTVSGEGRVEVKRQIEATRIEDGYGLLVCQTPDERRLGDFDVAEAMRKERPSSRWTPTFWRASMSMTLMILKPPDKGR